MESNAKLNSKLRLKLKLKLELSLATTLGSEISVITTKETQETVYIIYVLYNTTICHVVTEKLKPMKMTEKAVGKPCFTT